MVAMFEWVAVSMSLVGVLSAFVFSWRWPRLWLGATLLACAGGCSLSLSVLLTGFSVSWYPDFAIGGSAVVMELDALSAWFLSLACVVGACGAVYSHAYWPGSAQPSAAQGRLLWIAVLVSIALVLLQRNGMHFLLLWELFAICAFFLIRLDPKEKAVRFAAWLYLGASHVGTLCLFALFSRIAVHTGSWQWLDLRDQVILAPWFWLALIGFGIKAGAFPLHIWLPPAHASAPSHVSALLSGVAIKMGVYGLLRMASVMAVPESAAWTVLAMGALSTLIGIVFAFAQNDLKRLLAYCSVENIGIIFMGIGLVLLADRQGAGAWGAWVSAGLLLHIWNHGLFKSLLFLSAGSVLHATGSKDLRKLGGLWKQMPRTAWLFGFGALAVAALPPLNGFLSEWMLYSGWLEAVASRSEFAWVAGLCLLLLAIAGALALATFTKAVGMVFLGAPRSAAARLAHESPPAMILPMTLLALLCAWLATAPSFLVTMLTHVSQCWLSPAFVLVEPAAAEIGALGRFQWVLFGCAVAASGFLWVKIRSGSLVRGPTWDCGYHAPDARMQYTGASFSAMVTAWFDPLLRTFRQLRRPHGIHPDRAVLIERLREPVMDSVLRPLVSGVMVLSASVRRLQHGRLQSYVLYLLGGLLALSLLVFMGAAS
jgi:hydrogenase-4 component B